MNLRTYYSIRTVPLHPDETLIAKSARDLPHTDKVFVSANRGSGR